MTPTPPPDTFLGFQKLPARYAQWVMPFLLSVLMTCIVSLISTLTNVGLAPNLLAIWLRSWALSWIFAFPVLLLLLPVVRRATAAIVQQP
jgi:hypothetical protein